MKRINKLFWVAAAFAAVLALAACRQESGPSVVAEYTLKEAGVYPAETIKFFDDKTVEKEYTNSGIPVKLTGTYEGDPVKNGKVIVVSWKKMSTGGSTADYVVNESYIISITGSAYTGIGTGSGSGTASATFRGSKGTDLIFTSQTVSYGLSTGTYTGDPSTTGYVYITWLGSSTQETLVVSGTTASSLSASGKLAGVIFTRQ